MPADGSADLARAAEDLASGLPQPLEPLAGLAYNYRWSWTPGGFELFRDLDSRRFAAAGGNPVRLLQECPQTTLERAAANSEIVDRASALGEEFHHALEAPPDDSVLAPDRPVAFLCAEFGIHPSLPVYSGGLGVLAGDILKEASDRRLPFVGIGLLYRQGSYHQRLDPSGWQHDYWVDSDLERLPAARVTAAGGRSLTVAVPIGSREVAAHVWRVDVGRVPLYLLDTDRRENHPVDRWITARLYTGDRTIRLAQYVLLGVGGMMALRAMGIEPGVIHLNEGHAALAPLELAREMAHEGAVFDDALAETRARTVFTTHTPVAAGNEGYTPHEALAALQGYLGRLPAEPQAVLGLGRADPGRTADPIGMTVLGLRVSRAANGVSERHGRVAREMWAGLYPDVDGEHVPIGHVTNGVHLPTWMATPMRELLGKHLGEAWEDRAGDPETWVGIDAIPDEELWEVRQRLRGRLVAWLRERSMRDRLAREESAVAIEASAAAFHPATLTIGFARRVAGYKRLDLLVHDRDRLLHLLRAPHPFQLVLAGKSHPQDEEAKRKVQAIFELLWSPDAASRVAYVEDYDMDVATRLVQGCDVWVNLPRAPFEASGTSGMKAALNGGLNLSVLDGWWEEGFDGSNGWAIPGADGLSPEQQDERDARALYELLEREVIPLFYQRDSGAPPRGWVGRIKASLRTIGPRFCATRMLGDYVREAYRPSVAAPSA